MASDDELKVRIGEQIRRVRERTASTRGNRRASMTIEALAEASGKSANYLTKLELGHHQPSAALLVRVAAALRVDVRELFPSEVQGDPDRHAALEELRAFACQFTAPEIRWMIEVLLSATKRPTPPGVVASKRAAAPEVTVRAANATTGRKPRIDPSK